jgi:nucleoid-associated protein YgaU
MMQLFAATLAITLISGCSTTEKKAAPPEAQVAAEKTIASAKAAIKKAASVGGEWRDTGKILKRAQAAYDKGDYAGAMKDAVKAQRQAELGYKQAMDEMARFEAKYGSEPAAPAAVELVDNYTVAAGDSLSSIARQPAVYDNAYMWPLIFKANRDKIKDADLIYPGQVLVIDRAASKAEVSAAIRHTQTRGPWSVGEVEASDLDYLSR